MKKLLLLSLLLVSCTENERVKHFGGQGTLEVPENRRFVNITWKEDNIWIVTRERTAGEVEKKVFFFEEKSALGILEGSFKIVEK